MKIVLLTGSNQTKLAKKLFRSKEELAAIILPFKSKNEKRLEEIINFASSRRIKLFRPKRENMHSILKKLNPDILLSFGYPYLLDKQQLSVAKFNLNIHPSLLPKFRGPNIEWYIIASGAKVSGVTVHLIDEGMDSGAIVSQVKFKLSKFETIKSYQEKYSKYVFAAIKIALKNIKNPAFEPRKQDEKERSIFPKIRKPEDSKIDYSKSLKVLYDEIRACDPKKFPAFFEIDNQKVGIKIFRLNKPKKEKNYI